MSIGKGEIDFKHISEEIWPGFDGKVILEIVNEETDIIESKAVIEGLLKKQKYIQGD